ISSVETLAIGVKPMTQPQKMGPAEALVATPMMLLVFNTGSSSLKFDLLQIAADAASRRLRSGSLVDPAGELRLETENHAPPAAAPIRTLAAAADFVLTWLAGAGLLAGLDAT